MSFADGAELDTDMIVFSAGIRPRDELARTAGLGMGARGGVVINNNCLIIVFLDNNLGQPLGDILEILMTSSKSKYHESVP